MLGIFWNGRACFSIVTGSTAHALSMVRQRGAELSTSLAGFTCNQYNGFTSKRIQMHVHSLNNHR